MKFAVASLRLLVLSVVMLAIRGAANWSQSFGLAVAAFAVAVGSGGSSVKRPAMIVVLALPALVAEPVLIALIFTLGSLAD